MSHFEQVWEEGGIGAPGQPVWRCTMQVSARDTFSETILVASATEQGAKALCSEVRLDLTSVEAVLV